MNIDRRAMLGGLAALSGLAAGPLRARSKMMDTHPVFELRQYTLFGGRRDTLIELFEREFVAPQDAVGAQVLGTFRDLDDPDRFVWLRGFRSMDERAKALDAFYTGPVWRTHRDAANAAMVDSDNVLLLRAATYGQTPFLQPPPDKRLLSIAIHYLGCTDPEAFRSFFVETLEPRLRGLGARPDMTFMSENAANNFPRLPVRENEPVFVWGAWWRDAEEFAAFEARVSALSGWRDQAPAGILPALMRKPERLRLSPVKPA